MHINEENEALFTSHVLHEFRMYSNMIVEHFSIRFLRSAFMIEMYRHFDLKTISKIKSSNSNFMDETI
jgi:hypothetical protein